MKLVIITQHHENYAAHDWDGQGECPQYWKAKGGDVIIVNDVSVEQAQDKEFWEEVESVVSSHDDYFRIYIRHMDLVDDCDFIESNYVEEWESPIILDMSSKTATMTSPLKNRDYPELDATIQHFEIIAGDLTPVSISYRYSDGSGSISYKDWVKQQKVA